MKVELVPRATPLAPRAVVAEGAAAKALGARLVRATDEALARLEVLVGDGLLIALGETEALPWVEGVSYLGSDEAAPGLLVPTTRAPNAHPALVERALRRALRVPAGRLAWLPEGERVVSLAEAAPPSRARLQAWVEAAR
jgi:hypothetical protein